MTWRELLLRFLVTVSAGSTACEAATTLNVKTPAFIGRLYTPEAAPARPIGIVLIGGSEGHLFTADEIGPMLAARGYVVLGVDYNDGFAGPRLLRLVPIETFVNAVDWLRASGRVDTTKVIVLGQSRGSEAALLTAANTPSIAGVAAFVLSDVVWGSTQGDGASGWSLGGKPVPYVVKTKGDGDGVTAFAWAEARYPADGPARIAVECTLGPVLLIGSNSDGAWPSGTMVRAVTSRLTLRHFAYPVTSLVFSQATHRVLGVGPSVASETYTYPGRSYIAKFGGMAAGTEAARNQSWQLLLGWLNDFGARDHKRL